MFIADGTTAPTLKDKILTLTVGASEKIATITC
jgi:hypothetical protein